MLPQPFDYVNMKRKARDARLRRSNAKLLLMHRALHQQFEPFA
jgi:hypothetical protein